MAKQITLHKNKAVKTGQDIRPPSGLDNLTWWMQQYFEHEVSTAPSSRKAQGQDIVNFLVFMNKEEGSNSRVLWTPRLSRAFLEYLRGLIDEKTGRRMYADSTINRHMAHLKTFSKWVHKCHPFPLGDPMKKVTTTKTGTGLEIERALTGSERRRLLDAADQLLTSGGLSKDRNRYKGKERPRRKGYRPYRNRAIIYTLIETGMRRGGVCNLILDDIDFKKRTLKVKEKGGNAHAYHISREGLDAIRDYLEYERPPDFEKWQAPNVFLTAGNRPKGGKLSLPVINTIWAAVCEAAGVVAKTPHSARHAMGRHIVEKTGNVAAVQRQLGHKNAAYSMQYMRVTGDELRAVLDDRE